MNPTQSTIGRQKSTSKRIDIIDVLKVSRTRRDKFKTPKIVTNENACSEVYASHHSSFIKPTPATEEKKTFARLGEMRMQKHPYNNSHMVQPLCMKYVSPIDPSKRFARPSSKQCLIILFHYTIL
jgi:hypothetical protein